MRIRARCFRAWREVLVRYRRSKKLYEKRNRRRSIAGTSPPTVKGDFGRNLYSKEAEGGEERG